MSQRAATGSIESCAVQPSRAGRHRKPEVSLAHTAHTAVTPHQPVMNRTMVLVTFFSDSSSTRSLKPWMFSALAPKQNAGMP